jgi:hypothetical protein
MERAPSLLKPRNAPAFVFVNLRIGSASGKGHTSSTAYLPDDEPPGQSRVHDG